MKHFFFRFLLLTFLSVGATAQIQPLVDSLEKKIAGAPNAIEKIGILNDLAYKLIDYDNKKAFNYASQALSLSKINTYTKGQTTAINTLAIISKEKGNYSLALEQLKNALAISEAANDSSEMARCFYNIGDVFKELNSHDKAISYFLQSYEYYNALHQDVYANVALNKVAHGYMDKGNTLNDTLYYRKALLYYNKALKMSLAMDSKHRVTVAYINLANAYNRLGIKTGNKDYFFKSLDFSMRGLKLSKQINDKIRAAINTANIGEMYESLGQSAKALTFYQAALKLFEESDDSYWIVYESSAIAKLQKRLGDFPSAIRSATSALIGAQKQNLKDFICDDCELLSSIYASQNDFSKAYSYHKLQDSYKDSIANENNNISIARLQTELDADRKDKEIELLNKNREIQNEKIQNESIFRNFLIIGIVLLLGMLMLLYNRYRIKQKTEQQIIRAKETAELAKETQEQFLANTSHEIRTPMNGIIGMTTHLMDTSLNDEQLEYISAINESANNLLVIINDLLDLSKINAGKMTFEKRPFKISDLFKNLIYSLQYRSTEKNIRLISTIDEKIPATLIGDPIRLNQVLLNLAGNALKFTEKGEVKLVAKLLKDDGKDVRILFSIHDTGIGIPENKLDTIFESFTQVNAKTTRKYGGTGLGLAIVKQLIEQQGGTVSVSSKVNEGSTFSFTLQFRKQIKSNKEQKEIPAHTTETRKSNLSNIKILVVDDNKVNQRVAALTLQKWNAKVELADNARVAFEKLEHGNFDLVLMDVTMPEMDGIEATQHIRTKMEYPVNAIPIIAMTASALIGDREKCISVGMNEYVSKPFNPEDLLEKIIKTVPKKASATTDIIDLSLLNSRADGDLEYIRDILESYIQEMPIYVEEMNLYAERGNIKAVRTQAHKMKSPAKLLGAFELGRMLDEIELSPETETMSESLITGVVEMNVFCLQTVEALKKELNNMTL